MQTINTFQQICVYEAFKNTALRVDFVAWNNNYLIALIYNTMLCYS